ncbi:flavo protein monooxygenase [Morchella conica CCBAS932]|uniref:Flavo protein monooxygenase n=1 Tax=Morchella conica CCBAS932 TaxID=1392247 RepID=A0A3N4LB19_9PEZI|nr:flavo protein monooxygenase [Morchella conica CCBAS932]
MPGFITRPVKLEAKFTVIVVGGSITGLTLAHSLDRAGIDYIILERHENITPVLGSCVGIMPNGGRILDQLGLFDAIESEIEPIHRSHTCYPDGFSFTNAFPDIINERFGYPLSLLDRQKLLTILYDTLNDKSRVYLGKAVVKIEQLGDLVRVSTKDGHFYDGDLVVGADGVHSKVRSEMWKIADLINPGLITPQEKHATKAEYACIYGISWNIPELVIGDQVTCVYDGVSVMTFNGSQGRIIWFVTKKLDKRYHYPDIPRFTNVDAEKVCEGIQTKAIWGKVTFADIWAGRESYWMTALEENVFEHWHVGRVVCLGDSIHKLTQNIGQGANCAIESAAALANSLHDLINVRKIHRPSNNEMETCLNLFSQSRKKRMKAICKDAAFVTRLEARDGLLCRLIGRYYAPYCSDFPADVASKLIAGAVMLNYIPMPKRAGGGWMVNSAIVGAKDRTGEACS